MSVDVQTTPTFHAGIPRALFDPHIRPGGGGPFALPYGVMPDGQRFPVTSTGQPETAAPDGITVVLNWAESLKK